MDKMTIGWILAGAMYGVPGLLMIIINYYVILKGWRNSKDPEKANEYVPSGAPLLGGVLVAVGLVVALQRKHIWIIAFPLLLDPGGISGIIWSLLPDKKKKD